MTRSSKARLIRWAIANGSLTADTTPVGMAAYIKGYLRTAR